MDSFAEKYGRWVVRHRWQLIVVVLLFVGLAAAGAGRLTFDNDARIYFSEENPQLKALEALEDTFSRDYNVLYVIAPRDGTIFSRSTLKALVELTEESWQTPYSNRADSLTNFQHIRAEGDELIVEDLVRRPEKLGPEDLRRIRRVALSQPLLVNRLVSPDGRVAGINVLVTLPGESPAETAETAAFSRRLADEFQKRYPELDIYLTGGIIIDDAFALATKDDMRTLVPLMYAVLILITGLLLRSASATAAVFLVIAASMATGLGLAGWLGIILTPSSANAPTIILTLAVADSIHVLTTFIHQLRRGRDRTAAVVESLRLNLQPVFITSLTTAIGFLTMNYSDAPPFRDLGNIVAMGIVAAFVYSVTLLPALMSLLPLREKTGAGSEGCSSCDRLASLAIRRRRLLFWGALALVVITAAGVFRIELNDDFIKYFDRRYDFRRATDFAEANLTGFNVIEYSLDAGEAGGINDPEYLKTVDRFAEWYRNRPKVVHVMTVTGIIKRMNRKLHADDPAYYRLPDDRRLAAQYLLLYEMSLPFGLDLNNQINVDKSATRMVVRLRDVSSRELREVDRRARAWLQDNAPPEMLTYGTGMSIMFAHISQRNIESMLGASFGALVLISAVLILALRSFRIGLLSLLPNLAPAFMAFGIWGHLVGRVGLVVSILAALTLGIVVDDTIHFLSKYLRGRREHGMGPEDAVRYAFHTVGTALWMTTCILAAGFLVLAFSGFKINADMGLMTATTIVIALALDFLFLPSLLLIVEKEK